MFWRVVESSGGFWKVVVGSGGFRQVLFLVYRGLGPGSGVWSSCWVQLVVRDGATVLLRSACGQILSPHTRGVLERERKRVRESGREKESESWERGRETER